MNNNAPFMDDPINERLGRVGELTHPRYGHVKEPAVMVRVSNARVPAHRRAPEMGEHTDDILTMSGYTPDQIAHLRASGLVV
jgi:crotonobetainyl-CoA:carnitine CoA-transferase CaiB-like acyl-CoA transferase